MHCPHHTPYCTQYRPFQSGLITFHWIILLGKKLSLLLGKKAGIVRMWSATQWQCTVVPLFLEDTLRKEYYNRPPCLNGLDSGTVRQKHRGKMEEMVIIKCTRHFPSLVNVKVWVSVNQRWRFWNKTEQRLRWFCWCFLFFTLLLTHLWEMHFCNGFLWCASCDVCVCVLISVVTLVLTLV